MKYFLLAFLFSAKVFGALAAGAVWDIRSTATAANANGCFFVSGLGGTDYTKQNSRQYGFADLASTGGTTNPCVVTSASHNFVTADNGNAIHITAGTNWTQGWYQIVSTAGNAATLDRACGTAASISSGTYNVGGSCSLGSSTANQTDANLFNAASAGNTWYIQGGSSITYTMGGAVSVTTVGGASTNINVYGYNVTQGDNPTGATRPTLAFGANAFSSGTNWNWNYLQETSTAANGFGVGANGKLFQVKATNTSGTAGRFAFNLSAGSSLLKCEGSSTNGSAVQSGAVNATIATSYFHDSGQWGLITTGSSMNVIEDNIFENNTSGAISLSGAANGITWIRGNTLVGASGKLGTGLSLATGTTEVRFRNNIVWGFVTGVSHADVQTTSLDDFNDYFNNTADVTNWTKGANDIALDPAFTNAASHDYSVGSNMQAAGSPGVFPGGFSTGYLDIGAVQRKERASTDPGIANVKIGTGYTINDSSLTGTYDGSDRWTDPGIATVKKGTAYKANSTTNNRTGTYVVPRSSGYSH